MNSWLFGLITHKPADLTLSLHEVAQDGHQHTSPALGWGIGWFEGSRPKVAKQVQEAALRPSNAAQFAPGTSRIYLVYVDADIPGNADERNLDPFHYRNWLFAEKGSLKRDDLYPLLEPAHAESLSGESAAEVFFHWIVQNIKKIRDLVPSLLDSLRQVAGTNMSFLLSNGRWLFAYRNSQPMYYLERRFGSSERIFHYRVPQLESEVKSSILAAESAVVVSSEKLSSENWEEIPDGYLLAVTPRLELILVNLAESTAETA